LLAAPTGLGADTTVLVVLSVALAFVATPPTGLDARLKNHASELGHELGLPVGNDASKKRSFPGAYQSVLTVGAVDSKNRLASFSNTGLKRRARTCGPFVVRGASVADPATPVEEATSAAQSAEGDLSRGSLLATVQNRTNRCKNLRTRRARRAVRRQNRLHSVP